MSKLHIYTVFCFSLFMLLMMSAYAVEVFKISDYDGGHQIWFEAEAFDERNPEGDRYFQITGEGNAPKAPKKAFGEAITRAGGSGGMILWKFDISAVGGEEGTWYFWGRVWNPGNRSDYMLVLEDPGDKKIPDGPPFPGGDGAPPFINGDDRVFEQTCANWCWWGNQEGSAKELQDGENTMYIFHRQGNNTVFWDVFVWADKSNYRPTDDDYINAKEMEAGQKSVNPALKLATSWGMIKSEY